MRACRVQPPHSQSDQEEYAGGGGACSSEQARHVVQAVIQLAHGLGMEVVAEGVETEAQMQVLSRQGCDLVQGFHIASPMPAADVPGWMRDREHTPSLWSPLPGPAA